MCTAITYKTKDFYFGRTLDYEHSFGEEIVITPRNFSFDFRSRGILHQHHAIVGMARIEDNYPLYFDAVNEKGLAMAGLNFVGNAHYPMPVSGKDNIPHYAFIPWILTQCSSVLEAKCLLRRLCLTGEAFNGQLPTAKLHWLLADTKEAITIEPVKEGLRIYENPIGILTNDPPFDQQMQNLTNYMQLSADAPENRLAPNLPLQPYSRGMGAFGLPGDLSSSSRFVRGAFTKLNAVSDVSEEESVSQFFHILGTVSQSRGCCRLENGVYEITRYTSCCNASRGIYYYTTYGNHRITAVDMGKEDLAGNALISYPLLQQQDVFRQNGG